MTEDTTTKKEAIARFLAFFGDTQNIIGFNLLVNAMAFATEFGMRPYVEILPEDEYRVYYDYKKRTGESNIYHITALEEAAEWINEQVHKELQNNPEVIKNHPDYLES